jgi:ubiquinol-cytochrome c reductase iron-sulfur subunit
MKKQLDPIYSLTALMLFGVVCTCLYFLIQTGQPTADVAYKFKETQYRVRVSDFELGDVRRKDVYGIPIMIWRRNTDDIVLAKLQNNADDWPVQFSYSIVNNEAIFADDSNITVDQKWLVISPVNWGHFGCVVMPRMGDFNGFYDPCHGSHFDISGRVRKGLSDQNLRFIPAQVSDDGAYLDLDLTGVPGMGRSWQD